MNKAWRTILLRVLGALLNMPTTQAYRSDSICRAVSSGVPSLNTAANHPTRQTSFRDIGHVLCQMHALLRTQLQHAIDMYRAEQESLHGMALLHTTAPTPGTTTPPLAFPPTAALVPSAQIAGSTHSFGLDTRQVPLTPLSMSLHPDFVAASSSSVSTPTISHVVTDRDFESTYCASPLFVAALQYTQGCLFTATTSRSSPSQRQDLSLSLTPGRLSSALELLDRMHSNKEIRPKEVASVVSNGMQLAADEVAQALQVCQWNDMLDRVFQQGERSDQLVEQIPSLFDAMESQAQSIKMLYLLRTGLFKTVQSIGRMAPISLPLDTPISSSTTLSPAHGVSVSYPSNSIVYPAYTSRPPSPTDNSGPAAKSGPVQWKQRATSLSVRWTGRVIEWSGF